MQGTYAVNRETSPSHLSLPRFHPLTWEISHHPPPYSHKLNYSNTVHSATNLTHISWLTAPFMTDLTKECLTTTTNSQHIYDFNYDSASNEFGCHLQNSVPHYSPQLCIKIHVKQILHCCINPILLRKKHNILILFSFQQRNNCYNPIL